MRWPLLLSLGLLAACAGPGTSRRPSLPGPVASPPPPAPPPGALAPVAGGAPVPPPRAPENVVTETIRPPPNPARREPSRQALSIVARAERLVGVALRGRVARGVPDDCSGLVRLAYLEAGINLVSHGFLAGENAVTAIHRRARERGALHREAPQPGDLVFFQETYDRNRDGRRNDGMTHVGVVERVEAEGTVTFIHRGSKGVARSRMNLLFPRSHRAGGALLNDYLRAAARGQRAWLTGELFVDFASPEPL